MTITALIAKHLLDVHSGDNWTDVNIADTLADVTYEEAMVVTSISANSIAMLLHHISFWNRAVAQRAAGTYPIINEESGFDVQTSGSKTGWEKLKDDNLHSAKELAEMIRNFDETLLEKPILPKHSSAYSNFQGQVEHVHYHLGQILMLKKMIRSI